MFRGGSGRVTCQPEKRKVGSSTLPLTTSFGLVFSALTSVNADWALSCLQPSSDHDCPSVTVVGRSLSHGIARRALVWSAASRPELALPRHAVLTGRPSVFQAGHNPSRHKMYLRLVLSPVADACRWSLLLLSPLLSGAASFSWPGRTCGWCPGASSCGGVSYRISAVPHEGPFWDAVEGRVPLPAAAVTLGWELVASRPGGGDDRGRLHGCRCLLEPGRSRAGRLPGRHARRHAGTGPGRPGLTRVTFAPTTDLHVQFLRPARPGRLLGRGRVVRRGRDVGFLAGELLDGDGVVVAVATATVQIRARMLG